jgi:selenoprotein W-related protein
VTGDRQKPAVSIRYCTQELGSVSLEPGTGGIFEISVDGVLVWERKRDGGFPEAKVMKQRVRDAAFPDRDLGHSDRTPG